MDNKELFGKLKKYTSVLIAFSLLTIVCIVLFTICAKREYNIFLEYFFAGLIVVFLLILVYVMWMYNQRLKQLFKYSFTQAENEKRRTFDENQAERNHNYRLEVLKQETFHQIVKEISEKKEDTTKPNEKRIIININHSLINEIKKVKDEIDKTT